MSKKDAPHPPTKDFTDVDDAERSATTQASSEREDEIEADSKARPSAGSAPPEAIQGRSVERPADQSADRETARPAAAGSGGRGLALLALLFSAAALAGVGWLNLEAQQRDSRVQDDAALSSVQRDLQALGEQASAFDAERQAAVARLEASLQAQTEQIAALEQSQSDLQRQLEQSRSGQANGDDLAALLDQKLATVDQRVSDLAASQQGVESRFERLTQSLQEQQGVQREVDRDLALKLDLLESAAVLAMGQARIELVGDKDAALSAYRQASQQLAAASDGRLTQARERIAEEISLIESLTEPDWTTLSATLAQWERQVDSWPLRPVAGAEASAPSEVPADAEASGWLSGMRQSLGKLVTVERRDGLGPDAEMVVALREQLRLNLAASGLALERRDMAALNVRLTHIARLLDDFFDVENEALMSIRSQLDAMSELALPAAPAGLGRAAAALDRVIESL